MGFTLLKYYKSQLSSNEDEYYRKAFAKMVQIEGGHADFFARALLAAGAAVPAITGSLFDIAGNIVGESAELTGPINTCKLGVALEKKAIAMYHKFINEARGDLALQDKLMEYLLYEEFHALWLSDYAHRLEHKELLTQIGDSKALQDSTIEVHIH